MFRSVNLTIVKETEIGMAGMYRSLYNAIRNRIQLRIVKFNLKCNIVHDMMGGYENHERYRYKAPGPLLPS
jgi:hypothetical protein